MPETEPVIVVVAVTVQLIVAVLGAQYESPEQAAVIVCVPTPSSQVGKPTTTVTPKPVKPRNPPARSTTRKSKSRSHHRPAPVVTPPAPTPTTPTVKAVAARTYGLVSRHGLYLFGPANGSASSTLRVLPAQGKVCWSFGPSVHHKTAGQIDAGAPGANSTTVVSFGKVYRASGCVRAATATLNGLAKDPLAYYVSVDGGA